MKKFSILSAIATIAIFMCSFNKTNQNNDLIKLNDNLFVGKYEITNGDWLNYLNAIKDNKADYIAALPDTTVWRENNKVNEPFVQYYFRHPAYKNYPIVGISYEQAINYCSWRTRHNSDNLIFRLPTKLEWIEFSKFDITDKNKKKIKKSYKNYFEINNRLIFCNLKSENTQNDEITAPVNSYFPNSIGIYNVFGNVSEMISEKGVALGGDYETTPTSFKLDYSKMYDKPTKEIGLRIVAEKSK